MKKYLKFHVTKLRTKRYRVDMQLSNPRPDYEHFAIVDAKNMSDALRIVKSTASAELYHVSDVAKKVIRELKKLIKDNS